jgi:uncharacterized membrane protein
LSQTGCRADSGGRFFIAESLQSLRGIRRRSSCAVIVMMMVVVVVAMVVMVVLRHSIGRRSGGRRGGGVRRWCSGLSKCGAKN